MDIVRKDLCHTMRTHAGYVQLYLGVTPGILAAPCMRDLTTWVMAVIDEIK